MGKRMAVLSGLRKHDAFQLKHGQKGSHLQLEDFGLIDLNFSDESQLRFTQSET